MPTITTLVMAIYEYQFFISLQKKSTITEQLKAENQLEWVGKMNNIRSRAVEIIDVELICV